VVVLLAEARVESADRNERPDWALTEPFNEHI